MLFGVATHKRLPKPLVGHLGRQSNSLNFKAEERDPTTVGSLALYCAHRATVFNQNDPSKLAYYLFRDGG